MRKGIRKGDDHVREAIRTRHGKAFSFADRLLAACHQLHGRLCDKDVAKPRERAKAVAVGLWTKLCKQYRAVLVLCELGLTDDAEVIARSLFESSLQTAFVVKKNVKLRRGWKSAPKPPRGGYSMEFRAELYLARTVLDDRKRVNVWKQMPGRHRMARRVEREVDEMMNWTEAHVGRVWMKWLTDKDSRNAFQVETMAENLGLARWYAFVYRPQSSIAHAADAARHMDSGNEPMTVNVRLAPDVAGAAGPLRLANGLIGSAMAVVDTRFNLDLGEVIREMAKESQSDLDGT